MSQTTVREFFSKAVSEAGLRDRLKGAEDMESLLRIARSEGFDFSIDELNAVNPPRHADQLPDSKLAPPLDSLYCSFSSCGYTSTAVRCQNTVPVKQTPD